MDRRGFLADMGMGCAGMALGSMLWRDGIARAHSGWAPPNGVPHHPPKAKSVIWVFLSGGISQMESFDPKPALNRYAGKTFTDTPFTDPLKSPLFAKHSRDVVGGTRPYPTIFPMQVGHKKHGGMGMEVADWFPHLARQVDKLAFVRSMYTTDNDHGAEFQMHTGRHQLDEQQPVVGSWASYGLGTLNENLPQFVFLGKYSDIRVKKNMAADYLGPRHTGVELSLDPGSPLPFGTRATGVAEREQQEQFRLVERFDRLAAAEYPDDPQVLARIKNYELAFRMQRAMPEALDLTRETVSTNRLYGIDDPATALYGRRLLAARRLAERGVRFNLVYLSDYGEWDSHNDLKNLHAKSAARVDKPLAGLIQDLERTGLDREVMVVCCSEFGRTPGLETREAYKMPTGRDHHPHGFTVWFYGAGVKRGIIHGATDELGFHAVESPHYVTDMHATVLDRLGLDPRRLVVPGRKRLDIDFGDVIRDICA
ncbi:MAG: DUF1501 domain-containing protein [Planctomycetota bacterium]|nr:DUF1501 domain-containing protein [Planctomycetota bacterium]